MPQTKIETKNNGRINRSNEMPADLMATNSKLSPRLPNVIREESSIARGNANGTSTALWYQINLKTTSMPNPLPTKSSIYNQKNCITSTSRVIKNVAMNGPTNALRMSLSNFLNT